MHHCLLPAVMATAPAGVDALGLTLPVPSAETAPPHTGKMVYGTALDHRVDTDNFSIQWTAGWISESMGSQVGADMEAAWHALVQEQGWPAPTSSDEYLLTVILDPDLGGTGLTWIAADERYARGVPVMYVNPVWTSESAFMASLCAHEFGHALQFGVRDWYDGGSLESWYWEASAEWLSELARPEMDTYSWSAQYYAAAPHADHHSEAGYHQYGMFALNAYLDEYEIGTDGLREIWTDNLGLNWDEEIAAAVQEDPAWIWAGFSAAYVSGMLRESELYPAPITVDGTTVLEGWLGSHYIPLGSVDEAVYLSTGVGAVVRDGNWEVFESAAMVPEGSGEAWLVVVNPTNTPLQYSWSMGPWVPQDTGAAEEPATDTDRQGRLPTLLETHQDKGKGCGCATAEAPAWAWLLGLLVSGRRRASTS